MPKVKLNKRYILKGDKGKKIVEVNVETELSANELAQIDKKDIVRKEDGDEKK